MFGRRDRLTRGPLSQKGPLRALQGPHLSARIPPKGRGYAVIIPKKVLRRSVDRHRLKRRILGALREPPPLPLPPALAIYPKATALRLTYADLRAELVNLLTNRRF